MNNPLKINLRRQKTLLLSSISPNTIYTEALNNASSSSQLLATLSTILAIPAYTQLIATLFRPILMDLCARWLEDEDGSEQHLVALCYLLEVHEELFPYGQLFPSSATIPNFHLAFFISYYSDIT
jgi:midasin